jgi:hypothetical protein
LQDSNKLTFPVYWKRVAKNTFKSLRWFRTDLVAAFLTWIAADTFNYYLQGRQAASAISWATALSGLIPACFVLVFLFLWRVSLIAPFRLAQESDEKMRVLESSSRELLTPKLFVECKQDDNRYLRVRKEPQTGGGTVTTHSGSISICNPANHTASVMGVTVKIVDILNATLDFRDVFLRFRDRIQADPEPINPGDNKFIDLLSYEERSDGNAYLRIYHAGTDGLSGRVSPIPVDRRYVAKIQVTGNNMPAISQKIVFGIDNGAFYLKAED